MSAVISIGLLVGSIVGVAAQDERVAPVEFTGATTFSGCVGTKQIETSDGVTRTLSADVGRYCQPRIVEPFTDPRLQGQHYNWHNNDEHADGPLIYALAFSIVDDAGPWRGIPDIYLPEGASGDQILVGEGAYDGFTIIATVDLVGETWNWHGWIIEGDLPPIPTEPDAIP
jgi:hypothetical protein